MGRGREQEGGGDKRISWLGGEEEEEGKVRGYFCRIIRWRGQGE